LKYFHFLGTLSFKNRLAELPATQKKAKKAKKAQPTQPTQPAQLAQPAQPRRLVVSASGHCVNDLMGHVFPSFPSSSTSSSSASSSASASPSAAASAAAAASSTALEQIAFVGLPYNVVPFHMYELQSRWVGQTIMAEGRRRRSHDGIKNTGNTGNNNDNDNNNNNNNNNNGNNGNNDGDDGEKREKGIRVLPRVISSSVFASGRDDFHAHKMGELQWEYCHSLLQEIERLESQQQQQQQQQPQPQQPQQSQQQQQ